MPRFYHHLLDNDDSGKVVIERQSDDQANVYYSPSKKRLKRSNLNSVEDSKTRVRLLSIDGHSQSVTIFPINTFPRSSRPDSFLKPKYSQVKAITVNGANPKIAWGFAGVRCPVFGKAEPTRL